MTICKSQSSISKITNRKRSIEIHMIRIKPIFDTFKFRLI